MKFLETVFVAYVTFFSIPKWVAISRSKRFWALVLGWGHTLQTYFQSGALASMIANACITSCAPFDAASPPTVKIINCFGEIPNDSRTAIIFGSFLSKGTKDAVSHPTGSTSMVDALMPSLTYISLTQFEVTKIKGRSFKTSW